MKKIYSTERKISIASFVVLLLAFVFTLTLPILSIPFSFVGMIFGEGKIRKVYAFLLAFSLAIVAYTWVPDSTMDLYRHHLQVSALKEFNTGQLWSYIGDNLEPLHYFTKYFVAQLGDRDLLQFFVVLIGYFELFWVVCDYFNCKKTKTSVILFTTIYIVTALNYIGFISGLWFYLAAINTVLAIYLSYFKRTKFVHYLLYLVAACLHVGAVYIIVVVLLFSKVAFFKKLKLSTMTLVALVALSFGAIVSLSNSIFGVDFVLSKIMNRMYENYFINGSQFDALHSGIYLYVSLATVVMSAFLAVWYYRKTDKSEYGAFLAYLSVYILITMLNAGVFIRYAFLATALTLPMVVGFLEKASGKKLRICIIASLMALIVLHCRNSVSQMERVGLVKQVKSNVTNSVFGIVGEN